MFVALKMLNSLWRVRILVLLFGLRLALPMAWADAKPAADTGGKPSAKAESARTTSAVSLKPGVNDLYIAHWTAKLLERHHYSQQPFDEVTSSKFLDRYLRDLDFQHLHFLQSDLADFEGYRYRLDKLILRRGDTSPAYVIFALFLRRLEQHVDYVEQLLDTEKFTFDIDERVTLNRRDLPFPKDMNEAKRLWRDRLRYEYLQEKLNGKKHEEIVDILKRRYHRTLRLFREWDSDNVLEVYLTALAHVYDPHSDYMGKSQSENFAISMNLSLFGIGATLTSDDGYCKIRELVPEGPAAKSKKIKPGDRIVAVAQGDEPAVDVVDMPLNKAVQLIRGPKGTVVRLTIIPANAADSSIRKTVTLVRDEIKLEDQAAKAKIVEVPGPSGGHMRLGVIDLPSFYGRVDLGNSKDKVAPRSAAADVAKLLKKFKEEEVSGVILDLRRNGGGALEEAIKVAGLFIKEGPVVQVRDSDGAVIIDEDMDPGVAYDGPLVVLTDRSSASASEIVAGALQDYGRALIVGDTSTHGKGTVQSLSSLRPFLRQSTETVTNDPGTLKLTIRKFYRANGQSTQLKGVTPDIVLPSVNNAADVGEKSLENPLPWDTIQGAKFDRLNRVQSYLAELRERSSNRVNCEKDFDYVREDIDLVKKALSDKSVSLNEMQRRREKAEADAREKARQTERLARAVPDETLYEITLKLADQPGLPPPTLKTNTLFAANGGSDVEFSIPLTKNGTNGFSTVLTNVSAAVGKATGTDHPPSVPGVTVPTVTVTNAVSVTGAGRTGLESPNSSESGEEDKTPPADFVLEEATHILVDYLSLLPKDAVVLVDDSSRQR